MNLRRVRAVAFKEWRETLRDRMFLTLAFLVPIVWMVVFGYGMVLDVEHIPFAVLDHDQSELSRDYLSRFQQSRYFDFRGSIRHERDIDPLLAGNKVRAVLVIPEKFQERLLAGSPVNVQTLLDGTFPLRSDIAKGYVIAINSAFSQDRLVDYLVRTRALSRQRAAKFVQPVRLEVRYLYNQAVNSTWSMAPALVMFILTLSPPLLTALGVVREKERGSIYNIYSSTVTRLEFLIGKLVPYVTISTINVLILWLMAVSVFGAPFKGNPLFFFSVSVLFVLCTTGMGLIISMWVRTQQAALIITILASIIPTVNYSGMLVPVSSLAHGAQIISRLFPASYYTTFVRGTFLKGAGPDVLWAEVLILALYAMGLLSAGYVLFHKRPGA